MKAMILNLFGLCILCSVLAMPAIGQNSFSAEVIADIPVPEGYDRPAVDSSSFAYWLRRLPLRVDTARIHLYNGTLKGDQSNNYRVIDLPIGDRDLQQCADAAIRLRSDYLYGSGRWREIAFNFTNGDRVLFEKWVKGWRPTVRGSDVTWNRSAEIDTSMTAYRSYLDTVFMYAGSYSLMQELTPVEDVRDLRPGDCFIQGGFSGHVVIVVDMAIDSSAGETVMLLAQGFTPAQDIHILRNLRDTNLDPWYEVGKSDRLITPEWTFDWKDLRRFSE